MNIFNSNFPLNPFQQFKMDLQFLSLISFVWGLAVENARISDQSIPSKSLLSEQRYIASKNLN